MNIYLGTYLVGCLINIFLLVFVYLFAKNDLYRSIDRFSNENHLDRSFVMKIFIVTTIVISWMLMIAVIDNIINKKFKNK